MGSGDNNNDFTVDDMIEAVNLYTGFSGMVDSRFGFCHFGENQLKCCYCHLFTLSSLLNTKLKLNLVQYKKSLKGWQNVTKSRYKAY